MVYLTEGLPATIALYPIQLHHLILASAIIPGIGMLTGILISSYITRRWNQTLWNSFFVLIISILLFRFKLYKQQFPLSGIPIFKSVTPVLLLHIILSLERLNRFVI
jgi:hypothetical protein